MSTHVRTVLGE